MTEQECRALFFKEAYVLASSEPEMYRGFKIGLKVGAAAEREACAEIADGYADNIGPVEYDCGASVAAAIRARGQE